MDHASGVDVPRGDPPCGWDSGGETSGLPMDPSEFGPHVPFFQAFGSSFPDRTPSFLRFLEFRASFFRVLPFPTDDLSRPYESGHLRDLSGVPMDSLHRSGGDDGRGKVVRGRHGELVDGPYGLWVDP